VQDGRQGGRPGAHDRAASGVLTGCGGRVVICRRLPRFNGGTPGQPAANDEQPMTTHKMTTLNAIPAKVQGGQRLSFEDGLFLEEKADLFTLGELANRVRERKNGNFAYYNVNTHLNPTNVCVYRCTFCAFRADLKSPKGYVMSDEQILE